MTKSNLTPAIDRLGQIKAQIANLETEQKALRDVLVEQGPGAYEGELFRVTVTVSEREVLDMAAVREKLSPQFVRAHTSITEVTTVRVTARNNVRLKIAS